MAKQTRTTTTKTTASPRKASADKTTTKAKAPAIANETVAMSPVQPIVARVPATTSSVVPQTVTREMIAKRAYEIWRSGLGGSDLENWTRAERELRAAAAQGQLRAT